ncbi:hypothetical protein BDW69DRAFT_179004 [Aspergillus filifer]
MLCWRWCWCWYPSESGTDLTPSGNLTVPDIAKQTVSDALVCQPATTRRGTIFPNPVPWIQPPKDPKSHFSHAQAEPKTICHPWNECVRPALWTGIRIVTSEFQVFGFSLSTSWDRIFPERFAPAKSWIGHGDRAVRACAQEVRSRSKLRWCCLKIR